MKALFPKSFNNHHIMMFFLISFTIFVSLLGCPGPEPGEGGLRFCQKDSDCSQASPKLVCVWNLCQVETKCKKKPEVCNDRDDDCDGVVDNGNPGGGGVCIISGLSGPCREGKKICKSGKLECISEYQSKAEICANSIDDDCDGKVDNSASCGCPTPGTQRDCYTSDPKTRKKGSCKDGKQTCGQDQQWGDCRGDIGPSLEVCDNKDNDCDGQVDEGNPGGGSFCKVKGQSGPCEAGENACQSGKLVCLQKVKPKAKEICGNNIDDDCDGKTDEAPPCDCKPGNRKDCYTEPIGCKWDGQSKFKCDGICGPGKKTCLANQTWSACVGEKAPEKEICNGKDDDCNGAIDDKTLTENDVCVVKGQKGPCASGKKKCVSGTFKCTQTVLPKSKEVCGNGVDDDCDGKTDETPPCTCTIGKKRSCYSLPLGCTSSGKNPPTFKCAGICKTGLQFCLRDTKGTPEWGACVGDKGPSSSETCNGKDDDCDGKTDENTVNAGKACFVPGLKGPCERGKNACVAGKIACKQIILPKKEACNGVDDDCNGKTDELLSLICYTGTKGTSGIGLCKSGIQRCISGSWGISCVGEVRDKAETCNNIDDDCDGKTDEGKSICPAKKYCEKGVCVDKKPVIALAELQLPTQGTKLPSSVTFVWSNTGGLSYWLKVGTTPGGVEIFSRNTKKLTFAVVSGIPSNGQKIYVRLFTLQDPKSWGTSYKDYEFTSICKPVIEVCDGKDNDCDGKVDNIKGTLDPLFKYCYTGAKGCTKNTSGIYSCKGVCKEGKLLCTKGKYATACAGEVIPKIEIPGNGIDEDCDGKDGVVVTISGCTSGKNDQRWNSKMVGCDCSGTNCSVTPKMAPPLCDKAKGWHVCDLNEWLKLKGRTPSNTYRWLKAQVTCLNGSATSFCPDPISSFTLQNSASICAPGCKHRGILLHFSVMAGPTVEDCGRWSARAKTDSNGLLGRGATRYGKAESFCLNNSTIDTRTFVTGALCCHQ